MWTDYMDICWKILKVFILHFVIMDEMSCHRYLSESKTQYKEILIDRKTSLTLTLQYFQLFPEHTRLDS